MSNSSIISPPLDKVNKSFINNIPLQNEVIARMVKNSHTGRPEDLYIGLHLKDKRKARGFIQSEVGDYVDLTLQQIQKYEKGENGINASKLMRICDLFRVKSDEFIGSGCLKFVERYHKAKENYVRNEESRRIANIEKQVTDLAKVFTPEQLAAIIQVASERQASNEINPNKSAVN